MSEGWRRVGRGWRYLLLAYLGNLVLAAALGAVMVGAIESSLGSSLAGGRLRAGFDSFWFGSFSAQATGVASTLRPSVAGIGAVFDAVEAFLEGFDGLITRGAGTGVLPAALLYLAWWSLLTGGFVTLYAGGGEARGFIPSAARWFPKMVAVSAVALLFYLLVLRLLRPWVEIGIYLVTRDSIDERVHFAWTLGSYAAIWLVVWFANMIADYAKIALVHQPEGPSLTAPFRALWTAMRLVAGHPLRTAGLYLGLGLAWVGLLLLYWAVVPGAGQSSPAAIIGLFLLGQAFVFSRVWIRGWFLGAQTCMFEALADGRSAGELSGGER